MVWLTESETPQDMRIYAIGDVHGKLAMLEEVHGWIAADLDRRPAGDWRIVHIGDYVDRGEDSRGVVEYLRRRVAEEPRNICLLGNHDLMFTSSLTGEQQYRQVWLANGGSDTLASYGLSTEDFHNRLVERTGFDDVIPPEHVAFLTGLEMSVRFGDYLFVHAGIEPGVALEDQEPRAMLWIREGFLGDSREFDAVVVHGHTPVNRPEIRANRIGIDTGACYGGALTCLILQGPGKARLGPEGPLPLI